MMEHYSHARMAAKRTAVDGLATGLMVARTDNAELSTNAVH